MVSVGEPLTSLQQPRKLNLELEAIMQPGENFQRIRQA